MPKRTINAKEILADIKAGMHNAALMEKCQLSEKGLQNLFKKLTEVGSSGQGRSGRRDLLRNKVWKVLQPYGFCLSIFAMTALETSLTILTTRLRLSSKYLSDMLIGFPSFPLARSPAFFM